MNNPYEYINYPIWRKGKNVDLLSLSKADSNNLVEYIVDIIGSNINIEKFDQDKQKNDLPQKKPQLLFITARKKINSSMLSIARLLSDKMSIYHLLKSQKQIIKKINIQSYPSIGVIDNKNTDNDTIDNILSNMSIYKLNTVYDYKHIERFLYTYILDENSTIDDLLTEYPLQEIVDKDCYDILCRNSTNKLCFIAIIPSDVSINKRFLYLDTLKEVDDISSSKGITYLWIDSIKQKKFIESFNYNKDNSIDIILLDPIKEIYLLYKGPFNVDNIIHFLNIDSKDINTKWKKTVYINISERFVTPTDDSLTYTSPCIGDTISNNKINNSKNVIENLIGYDKRWNMMPHWNKYIENSLPVPSNSYNDIQSQLIIRNKPYIIRFINKPIGENPSGMDIFADISRKARNMIRFIYTYCGTNDSEQLAPLVYDKKTKTYTPSICKDSIYGSESLHVLMNFNNTLPDIDTVSKRRRSKYIEYNDNQLDKKALQRFTESLLGHKGSKYDKYINTVGDDFCSILEYFNGTTEDQFREFFIEKSLQPHLLIFSNIKCDHEIVKTAIEFYHYVRFVIIPTDNILISNKFKVDLNDVTALLLISTYTINNSTEGMSNTVTSLQLGDKLLIYENLAPILNRYLQFFSPPSVCRNFSAILNGTSESQSDVDTIPQHDEL